jgi:hypothetical protein
MRQYYWTDGASTAGDTIITRDAAQTLAQRNAGNAQTFRIYESFTDASNYTRGKLEWASNVLRIGTEKAGTGSARALELQTDGVTRMIVAPTGNITFVTNAVDQFTCNAKIVCPRDVTIGSNSSAVDGFGSQAAVVNTDTASRILLTLQGRADHTGKQIRFRKDTTEVGYINADCTFFAMGGTTSSFPAIKRNAAALNFRLADDSADCDITAAALTLSGNLTISTKNIVTDTTTGTKIGTATTQKLGFFNATPVVQPTAVADATDAASVITQLNALLSRMRDLGLIAL